LFLLEKRFTHLLPNASPGTPPLVHQFSQRCRVSPYCVNKPHPPPPCPLLPKAAVEKSSPLPPSTPLLVSALSLVSAFQFSPGPPSRSTVPCKLFSNFRPVRLLSLSPSVLTVKPPSVSLWPTQGSLRPAPAFSPAFPRSSPLGPGSWRGGTFLTAPPHPVLDKGSRYFSPFPFFFFSDSHYFSPNSPNPLTKHSQFFLSLFTGPASFRPSNPPITPFSSLFAVNDFRISPVQLFF